MKTMNGIASEFTARHWAMNPARLELFLAQLGTLDHARVEMPFGDAVRRSRMQVSEGRATIQISGVLLKRVPRILRAYEVDATAYSEIRADLAAALEDSSVKSIRLEVDSPGGEVAGVKELADEIAAARGRKPVEARIRDLGASGAYWLASQASQISALPNAMIGSIGVYSAYVDSSKAAENEGLRVHVVASGAHKGVGVPGSPITEPQLEALKSVIDGMARNFVADVARGRRRPAADVQTWATGRVWLAAEALDLGLVDSVDGQGKAVQASSGAQPSRTASASTAAPSAVGAAVQGPPCPRCVEKGKGKVGTTLLRTHDHNRAAFGCPSGHECISFLPGGLEKARAEDGQPELTSAGGEEDSVPCPKCKGRSRLQRTLSSENELRSCQSCGCSFKALSGQIRRIMTRGGLSLKAAVQMTRDVRKQVLREEAAR